MIGLLAFALPLTLYLSFPSSLWNFDGVACAAALELGDPVFLFHANHMLYGALGYLFWKFICLPLGMSRALPALQLFTSLLAAAGLVGLYRLLDRQMQHRALALLIALCFSAAAVFWVWSIEAQVYALGFFFLAWATYFLLGNPSSAKYRWVGLLHGMAVLGHLMHVLWLIPAWYWIRQEALPSEGKRFENYKTYLVWFLPTVALTYLLVLRFVIWPAHPDTAWITTWLKGSAALTPDRHWSWHTEGWMAPVHWAYSTLSFFWGTFWPYADRPVAAWCRWLTGISAAGFVACFARSLQSSMKSRVTFSFLWLGVYGLFLWTWEPSMLCYRMTECIPFAILLSLGLQTFKKDAMKIGFAAFLGASLLLMNGATLAQPMSRPELNPFYTQTMTLSRLTPDSSLYLTDGGLSWIYLLYFTGRAAWNVNHFPADRFGAEIARQKTRRSVFVSTKALNSGAPRSWIAPYKLQPVAPDLPWWKLQ